MFFTEGALYSKWYRFKIIAICTIYAIFTNKNSYFFKF